MQKVQIKTPSIEVSDNSNIWSIVKERGWTHIDGYVDPSPAVVIPEHLRIMEIGAGAARLTLSMPAVSFLEQLAEGLQLPRPERIATDERLSLSIELFGASLWEMSQRTRVVSLATVLEALLAPVRVSQKACNMIDQCSKRLMRHGEFMPRRYRESCFRQNAVALSQPEGGVHFRNLA